MSCKLACGAAALLLLGACDTIHPQTSADPGFGETVAYAKAAQTIDPDPVYSDEGAQPGDNGEKGAEAVKRYRSGEVKELERQATTSGGSGGSGGGPQ